MKLMKVLDQLRAGALPLVVALGMTLQAARAGATSPAEERSAPVRDIPELGLGTWLSDREKVRSQAAGSNRILHHDC